MSSENIHITPDNYEEYLLLYVDNELSASEREMVEAFLIVHPQYQIDLDILMSTKLPADDITFSGREALLSGQMKAADIDLQLLRYIDGEYTEEEKKRIEKQIDNDPQYATELGLLLKTKLDPADTIAYPNKKELYRHTSIRMITWMRVAAVVAVALFASALYFQNSGTDQSVAVIKPSIPSPGNKPAPIAIEQVPEKITYETAAPVEEEALTPVTASLKKAIEKVQPTFSKSQTVSLEDVVSIADAEVHPFAVPSIQAEVQPEKIASTPVTSAIAATYNNQEPTIASYLKEEDNRSKGSLKGFLRKATRMIERATGVSSSNDDEELLIGALALKL